MTLLLGIDTGGTYTDAVLVDETAPLPGVLAKAKAPTTHHDLAIGIAGAIDAALAQGHDPAEIGLVSVSTTLATNALVEGQGGRICLLLIGFDEKALSRAGLAEAVGQDPVVFAAGGHGPGGTRQAPLDRKVIADAAQAYSDVDGFAIVAHFGTRDPSDEIAARDIVAASGLPVTCGHELAAELGGPKRAVTAVLNARLIPMIAALIEATEGTLASRGIRAPLMMVRGDGALVSASFARARPIETILSGPAASLVGAAHLTGLTDAIVSDIGGTTTDIAVLRVGRPALSPQGATVGGHRTMVGAVDMATHGLGGDSEVRVDETSLKPRIVLGPRRVRPISMLAAQFPDIVHAALDTALAGPAPGPHDARLVSRRAGRSDGGLRDGDRALLSELTEAPRPAADILKTRLRESALTRLVARGLVEIAAFTPTDAAHVTDQQSSGDSEAAHKAARLMARRRDAGGRAVADSAEAVSRMVQDALVRRSAEVILDASLAHDGFEGTNLSATPLAAAALSGHQGAARVSIGLDLPLVGLGASAPLYYPDIARTLGTASEVPDHADVSNAIGAVAGRVHIAVVAHVSQPADGVFRVHLPAETRDCRSAAAARDTALAALREIACARAAEAGSADVELTEDWQATTVPVEGTEMFVEARAEVTASGRPRIVTNTP
ncbi:MAG: hydantoinase/oxoprolinase family protein [Pseudomonadota bacterium]